MELWGGKTHVIVDKSLNSYFQELFVWPQNWPPFKSTVMSKFKAWGQGPRPLLSPLFQGLGVTLRLPGMRGPTSPASGPPLRTPGRLQACFDPCRPLRAAGDFPRGDRSSPAFEPPGHTRWADLHPRKGGPVVPAQPRAFGQAPGHSAGTRTRRRRGRLFSATCRRPAPGAWARTRCGWRAAARLPAPLLRRARPTRGPGESAAWSRKLEKHRTRATGQGSRDALRLPGSGDRGAPGMAREAQTLGSFPTPHCFSPNLHQPCFHPHSDLHFFLGLSIFPRSFSHSQIINPGIKVWFFYLTLAPKFAMLPLSFCNSTSEGQVHRGIPIFLQSHHFTTCDRNYFIWKLIYYFIKHFTHSFCM